MIIPGTNVTFSGSITTIPTTITPSSLMATIVVSTIATKICAVDNTNLVGRKVLTIQNNSLNAIYLNNIIGVTKDNGILLPSGATMEFDFDPTINTNIYGISIGVISNISVVEA